MHDEPVALPRRDLTRPCRRAAGELRLDYEGSAPRRPSSAS